MAVVKEFTLNVTTAEAQANVEELNASFRAQESLIEGLKSELESFEKELSQTTKTEFSRRKSLNNQINETKTKLVEEVDGLKNVTKERVKANNTLKNATKNTADFTGVLGMVDAKTGGLISGLDGMKTSILSATKGFNLMKVAIIGTGIGALLIGLLAIGKAFTSSEKGQNQFNKLMAVMGAIVDVFVERLASLGSFLIDLFTSPLETLKNFGKGIQDFVMDKVNLAIESLGFMGSAISKLFSGDFSGALVDAGTGIVGLNKALNPAVILTDALVNSTKDLINELAEESKIIAKVSDQRAEADKLDRQLILDRAKANRDRADLLNKAVDKENFTLEQRIGFLQEAGRLEDEITQKEIAAAQLRLDAQIAENSLGATTKDQADEEVRLKAELLNLETAKIQKDREVTAQVIALKAEEAAAIIAADNLVAANKKEIDDAEKVRLQELANLKNTIRDSTALFESERRALELIKIQEHYDALLAQAIATEGITAIKLGDIAAAGEKAKTDKQKEFDDIDIAREEAIAAKKIAIQKSINDQKKALQTANLNVVSQGFALLGQLAGKNKAIQAAAIIGESAVGIAKTVIATQASNAATIAQGAALTIPTLGASVATAAGIVASTNISAGIGIAMNVAATAKALQGLKAGGSPPPPPSLRRGSGSSSSSIPTPPEFNTVGASGTNQLADAIGSQTNQPIKTFVVASDVTTAQGLERNTISGATIG